MGKRLLSTLKTCGCFLGVVVITFLILNLFVPRPKNMTQRAVNPKKINYTAIGDSITHGVGDTNNNQGFVGALRDQLEQEYQVKVHVNNFGYTGETSQSIKEHILKDKKLRKAVTQANFLTLDMGGNDMIYTIQNNFFKLDKKEFVPIEVAFKKNLSRSLDELRILNPKAKIIVVGIYNPFYLFFGQIKDMNTLFKEWNNITIKVTRSATGIFYQDTDGIINGPKAKENVDGKISNRYLSTKDDVHPNGLGYSLIANALFDLIKKNKIVR